MSITQKDIVIQIEHAVVAHRENIALCDVNLKIFRGDFVGVIGPNGAGKTTLLTIKNGMGKLTNGNVNVLGYQIKPGNGHNIRKKIGYVSQAQNIDSRMPVTVREVVLMGRYGRLGWFRTPGERDQKIVYDTLHLVGMAPLAERPIGHLSGGEQQRVALARCLAQEPEILLLDEPAASLDLKAKADILELVKLIHDERRLTTLFVTHDLSSLPIACDRVVLMKNGGIWREGLAGELLTDDNLSSLFDLPIAIIKNRKGETVISDCKN